MDERHVGGLSNELSPENRRFIEDLPAFAKGAVDPSLEVNQNFLNNLDSPEEHGASNWHQFGILTHTRKFVESLRDKTAKFQEQWGIDLSSLDNMIGNKTKNDLLMTASIFHDIGKFTRGEKIKDGRVLPDYKGHEAKSESIIRDGFLREVLIRENYSEEQIEYIARCAGLHYELGKLREVAKRMDLGYTIAFARSEECMKACREIILNSGDYALEAGLLFLADSLSKTDLIINANNDTEIESQTAELEEYLKENDLNPSLINYLKQVPVNIAVARTYFEVLGA